MIRRALLLLTLLFALGAFAVAQAAGNPAQQRIKAAYLLNFAKFIRWPALQGESLTFCIIASKRTGEFYAAMLDGQLVQERSIRTLIFSSAVPDNTDCQLLYLERHSGTQKPVSATLTVANGEDYVSDGGMIAFVQQGDHIRFLVNLSTARAAGLEVDAQLLSVALKVMQ